MHEARFISNFYSYWFVAFASIAYRLDYFGPHLV